jgi:hypothetical protein
MATRHSDTAIRLAKLDDGLWYQPVQIRRGATGLRSAWSEFGAVLPLGRAVRDALKLLEKETLTIHFVHPPTGVAKINEIDILYLARRPDYPFRDTIADR